MRDLGITSLKFFWGGAIVVSQDHRQIISTTIKGPNFNLGYTCV